MWKLGKIKKKEASSRLQRVDGRDRLRAPRARARVHQSRSFLLRQSDGRVRGERERERERGHAERD